MSQNLSAATLAAPPDARERSIRPLPDHVAAQIKSSTAVTSLNGVVLELLSNSLDAKASKVDVTVDFPRGGCTVEDDGVGIAPLEFREDGGLGKLYYTSKYHSQESLLGRNGTFLASLAAMCLMTLTSHHHEHRSHNSLTFHHSKAIERQLPAASNNRVHGKHGTRVTVRNLFGNLPVRVKHRSVALEQKAEHDRLWDALKRRIAALLLSWRGPVSLRVRDSDNRVVFSFNTSKSVVDKASLTTNTIKPCSTQLSSVLNVLTQADYVPVDEWASWVPASAVTTTLSIKGAISLIPAPSKHVQYISLGIRPLIAESGHNELYDQVNRQFALSNFGTVEEDDSVDELEKIRRQSDKRYKSDGYTNRQLKARKDVDRYPMFHLRILFDGGASTHTLEDSLVDNETTLQAVVEVLRAMITQWLSVHHFRPREPRTRRDRPATASTSASEVIDSDSIPALESDAEPTALTLPQLNPRPGTPGSSYGRTSSRKRKRIGGSKLREEFEKTQHHVFAEWSRIKSGKADFFSNLPTLPKLPSKNDAEVLHDEGTQVDKVSTFASFEMEPIPRGALSAPTASITESVNQSYLHNDERDETVLWTDPSTKKTHVLNARTGSIVPNAQARPHTVSDAPTFFTTQSNTNKPLRLAPKSAGSGTRETPWLDNVLQTWDNPIFKPSEQRIRHVLSELDDGRDKSHGCLHHDCSHSNIDKAFNEASAPNSSRLSKEGIRNAQVIAQVDKKFILVKMHSAANTDHAQKLPRDLVVLIDQHAADERIQVEALFQDLCTPVPDPPPPSTYRSKLGHTAQITSVFLDKPVQLSVSAQERTHFTTHAARFAAWGILYELHSSPPASTNSSIQDHPVLSVTSLPPTISTRCTAHPKLLISLLRSTVWNYASDPHLASTLPPTFSSSTNSKTAWVRRLASCPLALVDLINSRACRSAIMFNDELSQQECEDLVQRLGTCVFPFMCAHGRPSMVPLVELGQEEGIGAGAQSEHGREGADGEVGFVQRWKAWRS